FDRNAFESTLQKPYRHRQVFAARSIDGETLFNEMNNSLDAYEHDFGEGPGTLHVAAVLYGGAASIALDSVAWAHYKIESRVRRDQRENPFVPSIQSLMGRGASFFVCNKALTGLAVAYANATSTQARTADDVLADMQKHIINGVTLVPAGVAA